MPQITLKNLLFFSVSICIVFFSCKNKGYSEFSSNEIICKKALTEVIKKYPQLQTNWIRTDWILDRVVVDNSDSFRLELYKPDYGSELKIIVAARNGHAYAIPMFSDAQFDYWNMERDSSQEILPPIGTTFEKELKACIKEVKVHPPSIFYFREIFQHLLHYDEEAYKKKEKMSLPIEIIYSGYYRFVITLKTRGDFSLRTLPVERMIYL